MASVPETTDPKLVDRGIEAAAIEIWHRFAPAHRNDWNEEPNKDEYLLAAASAVSAYATELQKGRTNG